MSDSFYKRMRPLIDQAAFRAKRLASKSSWNPAYLWTVFMNEKNRLTWTAIRLETEVVSGSILSEVLAFDIDFSS